MRSSRQGKDEEARADTKSRRHESLHTLPCSCRENGEWQTSRLTALPIALCLTRSQVSSHYEAARIHFTPQILTNPLVDGPLHDRQLGKRPETSRGDIICMGGVFYDTVFLSQDLHARKAETTACLPHRPRVNCTWTKGSTLILRGHHRYRVELVSTAVLDIYVKRLSRARNYVCTSAMLHAVVLEEYAHCCWPGANLDPANDEQTLQILQDPGSCLILKSLPTSSSHPLYSCMKGACSTRFEVSAGLMLKKLIHHQGSPSGLGVSESV